jgi:hypothetical protein
MALKCTSMVLWTRLSLASVTAAGMSAAASGAALTFCSRTAAAQGPEGPPLPAESVAPVPTTEAPPSSAGHAPYSLPFQLRPVTAQTAIRSDTSFGTYQNTLSQNGFAVVSELSGSWRIPGTESGPRTGLAPLVKFTVVNDSPPGTATGGFAFVNPLVGAWYAFDLGSGFRASTFLGVTIPVGMGGGNTPNKGALDARTVGPVIRAGVENPLFAVNDLSMIPGLDLAYVDHGLTLQLEATICELVRVRGAETQLEASKTAFVGGAYAGYFLTSFLSLGAEFRIQWWLDPPFAVQNHKPNTSYDLTSLGVGPRFLFRAGPDVTIRPGIAYSRGFDPPMTPKASNDSIVQLDIPVVF